MTELCFAVHSTAQTREITHAGRSYLVAPVVALREGVLNGVLVEAVEFAKYPEAWMGRPCPISHPQLDGKYISANWPDVWANDVPGHFWNVEADGDKLRGEIWIDLEKAERIGERAMQIVTRLRANQPIEVSTGYFCDTDETPGLWKGVAYSGIARNIRPDHLALLPDEIGACTLGGRLRHTQSQYGGQHERGTRSASRERRGLVSTILGLVGPAQGE